MKRLSLLLLLLVSTNVFAEWTPVTRTSAFIEYSDKSSKIRSGDMVRIWSMNNYILPQPTSSGKKYLSKKIQNEFDCTNQRYRLLSLIFYSLNLGYGDVVSMYDSVTNSSLTSVFSWKPLAPGTTGSELMIFACGN